VATISRVRKCCTPIVPADRSLARILRDLFSMQHERSIASQTSAPPSAQADLERSGVRRAVRAPVHVRIVDVHKSYGDHEVLKGVTFDVYRGLTNLIIGVSGSGKTVLLRQLICVERPDCGRVEIDGVDLLSLGEVALVEQRKRFGMVFQESALFDSLSVYENVAFPLREHSGLDKAAIDARVMRQLAALDVLDARDKLPSELSGGMRKRVAVARAMVSEPEVLIYDEPTRGLDPLLARSVDQLIERTRQRYGVTSIVISHDVKTIIDIAHHVNVLDDGRIVYSAPRDEFLTSTHPLASAFVRASGVRLSVRGAQRS
jgi:phospholipid/cholesterol/gamma-HCH transport system ATP-binding protein